MDTIVKDSEPGLNSDQSRNKGGRPAEHSALIPVVREYMSVEP